MKESFDPLAEAERRSDPQLVRYNETIGHDPSTNADYAAYLRTRDFGDANGNVHDAKTSKFKARGDEGDTYETDLVNSAHTEALEENALRDSSLDALAKKVAEARNSGDAEAAAHAEDLFFDKFTKLSEKYGWEEDDESANETLHVDKDAKVGRTTIDDRLARYSKIMYGEEADTAVVKSSEPVAESEKPAAAEEVADEADHVEKESTSEPEAESEATPVAEAKTFDVNAEVEQANERLRKLGEEREQQANEARNGSEAAKADRELIALVSKKGLEDLDEEPRIKRVSTEGLEPEESDKITRVSTEGLEEDEPARSPAKKPLGRIEGAMAGMFARLQAGRTEAKHRKDSSEKEPMSRNKKIAIALGAVAATATGLFAAHKFGMDINPFNDAHASGTTEAATEPAGRGSRGGGAETPAQFSKDALRVDRGEGLFQTFKEMGIPKDKWQEVLDQSGPKLVRMGEAYNDPSIGGFGLKGDGRLSARALGVIADTARNVK